MPRAEELGLAGFSSGLMGFLVRWCNGSTEVFGAFSRGSNPRRTASQHYYSMTTQTRTQITDQTSSKPSTVLGFAVLGCLAAGVVGILKALSMETGSAVLLCLLGSVAAFGMVAHFCLRRV